MSNPNPNPEHALTGRAQSAEHVRKRADAIRAAWQEGRLKGHPMSEETKAKIGAAHRGRKHSEEFRRQCAERMTGRFAEQHNNWKGDQATQIGVHAWIKRHFGPKSGICEHCGEQRKTQWANRDHAYSRAREDWMELCPSCHKKHDLAAVSEQRGRLSS